MSEMYSDPINILNKIQDGTSEMTEWQLSFLCGLIKENEPKKILEIGVAAGGTTSVILNCLALLKLDSEVFSIDINEKLYSDNNKYTGYLVEKCLPYLPEKVERTLYTNGLSVEFLEKIGYDIDFLILDTKHTLPGELLDFLACLPYLKVGGVVVLHDIALHHIGNRPDACATQVLLDTVVGNKIITSSDPTSEIGYPNIGAFYVTPDTKKYVGNIFGALMLSWQYIPEAQHTQLYREFFSRHYEKQYIDIFDKAVELNTATIKRVKSKREKEFCETVRLVADCSKYKTYIYGYGKYGRVFGELLQKCGVDFGGYIISEGHKKAEKGIVHYLSEIEFNEATDIILIGVNEHIQSEIKEILIKQGIKNYLLPNSIVCDFIGRQ